MSGEFNDIKPHGYSLAEAMSIDLHAADLAPAAIEKAKALLRLAGYWVVPQGRVLTVGGQYAISDRQTQLKNFDKLRLSLKECIAREFSNELIEQEAICWEEGRDENAPPHYPKHLLRGEIRVIMPVAPK